MFDNYKDIVSVDEMCQMLNISVNLAYKLLKENCIQHRKVGRAYRIPKKSIIDYMEDC